MMNAVLQKFLWRCVLVFFDDILVYSASWAEHLQHVRAVFQVLRDNQLAVKQSKCTFGERSVSYLGHIITGAGVTMDPAKIEAVQAWPTPTTVRALRGFLRLTVYYRKFIRDYDVVARPLMQLLKKEVFTWTAEADTAFATLKTALTRARHCSSPTSIGRSSSTATCLAPALAQYSTKRMGPSRSIAAPSRHTMPSSRPMSGSSSDW
jgi:hypothetical protein